MRIGPTTSEMMRAVGRRDASYDGVFVMAVRTTSIFCKPSCPARKPRRENVTFFRDADEAMAAGYRACQRCKPAESNGAMPEWMGRLLTRMSGDEGQWLSDEGLRAMSLEPTRVRRAFRHYYGSSFQEFQRNMKMSKALQMLHDGADVTTVADRTGYESVSGFSDAFTRTFGQSPSHNDGLDCIFLKVVPSPVGALTLGATSDGVCVVAFDGDKKERDDVGKVSRALGCPALPGENEHLEHLAEELDDYFAGRLTEFTVPLLLAGTAFQKSVWAALQGIPFGETFSYERLAKAVKRPTGQRAVGTANGANPIAIVIPCHRVVRKDGSIGGYGGGLWRKAFLLEHEQGLFRQGV